MHGFHCAMSKVACLKIHINYKQAFKWCLVPNLFVFRLTRHNMLPFLLDAVIHFWISNFFQSAVGHEYQSKLSKHCSQVDSVRGFGGKFGVQVDRVDQVSNIL